MIGSIKTLVRPLVKFTLSVSVPGLADTEKIGSLGKIVANQFVDVLSLAILPGNGAVEKSGYSRSSCVSFGQIGVFFLLLPTLFFARYLITQICAS
jgi:hypothetical protein